MANLFQPKRVFVPGLLSDEGLAAQVKELTATQKATTEAAPPNTSAVEFASQVSTMQAGKLGTMVDQQAAAANDARKAAQDAKSDKIGSDIAGAVSAVPGVKELGQLGVLTPERQAEEQDILTGVAEQQLQTAKDAQELGDLMRGDVQPPDWQSMTPDELAFYQQQAKKQLKPQLDALKDIGVAKTTPPKYEWWRNAAEVAARSAASVGVDTLKFPADVWDLTAETITGQESRNDFGIALDGIDKALTKMLPGDPARSKEFVTDLASGAGSMTGFLIGGFATKTLRIGAAWGSGVMGAAVNGNSQYEDAQNFDANVTQKWIALIAGAGLGATEAIPIDRAFFRADVATGGLVRQMLANSTATSIGEFSQELAQAVGTDLIAKLTYDEGRDLNAASWLRQATVGAIVGGGSGAVISLIEQGGEQRETEVAKTDDTKMTAAAEEAINAAQQDFDTALGAEAADLPGLGGATDGVSADQAAPTSAGDGAASAAPVAGAQTAQPRVDPVVAGDAVTQIVEQQRAYHGTPHKVDKFSMEKIGTGEGAQAFGHGLYFAGNKTVAEGYQTALAPDLKVSFQGKPTAELQASGDAVTQAARVVGSRMETNRATFAEAQKELSTATYLAPATRAAVKQLKEADFATEGGGQLYQVDIPADAELLDWDKPLSEQAPAVQDALAKSSAFQAIKDQLGDIATGNEIYTLMSRAARAAKRGATADAEAAAEASKALLDAGIPGLRYLDAGSRADGDGTRNYVIFDDSRIQIADVEQQVGTPANPDIVAQVDAVQLEPHQISPLPDIEKGLTGPIPRVVQAAKAYAAAIGLPHRRARSYVKVDTGRAARVAEAYTAMKHEPTDPAVLAAYQALADETVAQYQYVKASGIKIETILPNSFAEHMRDAVEDAQVGFYFEEGGCWGMALALNRKMGGELWVTEGRGSTHAYNVVDGVAYDWEGATKLPASASRVTDIVSVAARNGVDSEQVDADAQLAADVIANATAKADPYPNGPRDVLKDINAGHIWYFPTDQGFGSSEFDPTGNPLLEASGETSDNGQPMVVNDLFRVVHDFFGHGLEGAGFGARGEENAWQSHMRLFTASAVPAMTSETRGQNSWVNYGPFGEQNRADPKNTTYADQKTGLMPSWTWTEGVVDSTAEDVDAPVAADAAGFETAFLTAKNASPFGAAVHAYSAAELAKMRTFLAPDGLSGFALKGIDIVSVFSHPAAGGGRLRKIIDTAVANGGKTLDAFDGKLVQLYSALGFREVRRESWSDQYRPEGWKDAWGKPDVVFMEYDGDIENAMASVGRSEQINSPAFKAWFGQSKVVDAEGKPLIVYHGTAAPDFAAFQRSRSDVGMHFGTAGQANDRTAFMEGRRESFGSRMIPVYLRIRNPLRMTDAGAWNKDNMDYQLRDKWPSDKELIRRLKTPKDIREYLKSKGHDGIVYRNTGESNDPDRSAALRAAREAARVELNAVLTAKGLPLNVFGREAQALLEYHRWRIADDAEREFRESEGAADSYIVFEPTQIKSAIGNRGTFDPTDPDILRMTGTATQRMPYALEPTRPTKGVAERPNEAPNDVTLTKLANNLVKQLNLTLRQGRLVNRNEAVMGEFNRRTGVIRLRTASDLSTLAHEAGHAINDQMAAPLDAFVNSHLADVNKIALIYQGDLSQASAATKRREGFGEFFRVYVTAPQTAKHHWPQFTADFEALIDREAPRMKEGLNAIAAGVSAWQQLPSGQLIENSVIDGRREQGIGPAMKELRDLGFKSWMQELVRRNVQWSTNRYAAINRLVADLLNEGEANRGAPIDLARADDPRTLVRLARNSGSRGMVQVTDGVIGYKGTQSMSKGLREAIMVSQGVDPNTTPKALDEKRLHTFSAYLVARRALEEFRRFELGEIDRQPTAFKKGDAVTYIRETEAKYPDFVKAADIVHGYGMALWQKSYDAGLIAKETYEENLTRQFYVPLQRDMSDKKAALGDSALTTKGSGPLRSIVKRFRGSDRDIIDPLSILMQKTFALEQLIAENDAKKALAVLSDRVGVAGALVERIPASQLIGQEFGVREVARQLTGLDDIADTDAADLMTILGASIKEGDTISLFRSQQASAKGEPVLFFWENGKVAAIQVKDGDIGADVVNTMNAVGRENMDKLLEAVAATSTVFRTAITSWPDFLLVNFVRDQMSAFILTEGFTPFVSGIRGVIDEVRQKGWAKLYNQGQGIMGGMNVAAQHTAHVDRDIRSLRAKGYLPQVFGDVRSGWDFTNMVKGLARISAVTETGTRLGIFKASYNRAKREGLDDYQSTVEAAYTATDYIDFGLNGNKMMTTRRLIPFLNAQIQGLYKMVRTLGGDEVAQRKGLMFALTAYFKNINNLPLSRIEKQQLRVGRKAWLKMMSLGLISAALHFLFKDDEDYQEAGEYLRTTGWVIPMGNGQIFYVPKPFELAMVANAVERGLEGAAGDASALDRFKRGVAFNLTPPTTPPLFQLGFEIPNNVDTFTGRPIVPDYMRALAPELQYDNYTSNIAKWLGGTFRWSPMVVDHVMGAFGASAYRDLATMTNAADPTRPAMAATDAPLLRRFVRDVRRGSVSAQDFWSQASSTNGALAQAAASYKYEIDAGNEPAANRRLAAMTADQRAFAVLMTDFKGEEKRLNPFYRATQITTLVSKMRREASSALSLGDTTIKDSTDTIPLTATKKREVDTILSEIARREVRNTLIATGQPGWKGKDILPVEPTMDLLLAAAPEVYDELQRRWKKAKVYDAQTVYDYWPDVRDRLVQDGPDAVLADAVAVASAGL